MQFLKYKVAIINGLNLHLIIYNKKYNNIIYIPLLFISNLINILNTFVCFTFQYKIPYYITEYFLTTVCLKNSNNDTFI